MALSQLESPRQVVNLNHDWSFIRLPSAPAAWETPDKVNRSSWRVVSASSEETARENGAAKNAIDGNGQTHWHSQWSRERRDYPHEIFIDLGGRTEARALWLLPRQTGPRNALPATVRVLMGDDAKNLKPIVASASLAESWDAQTIAFPQTATGRYLKVVFDNGRPDDPHVAISEIALVRGERATRTGWESQYNVAEVLAGDDRHDLKGATLENVKAAEMKAIGRRKWERATLPHTAKIEKLGVYQPWQGVCYYRRQLEAPDVWKGKTVVLTFEGAMQVSDVWVNCQRVGGRRGGYLPVVVDLTSSLKYGQANEILVRLDNQDNPLVPPGKPTPQLDFLYWSGLYRDCYVTVTEAVSITDPILANLPRGGGVTVACRRAEGKEWVVTTRTHVANRSAADAEVDVELAIVEPAGKVVATASASANIGSAKTETVAAELTLADPSLWTPDTPSLFKLIATIKLRDKAVDRVETRFGVRSLAYSRDQGFLLNGKPLRLIGTNRHQEYPYIGNALSNDAGYRDMAKIKEAGFNCVRLSHYPMDPAVMDACDELGLLTIPCIAGWQFTNRDPRFQAQVEQDIRDLIRRDRNHPCVLAWETSLNETYPPKEVATRWWRTAHEEFTSPDMTAVGDGTTGAPWDWAYNGWVEDTKARPQDAMPDKPGYIREYGDYEFGGAESTTRQPMSAGEKGNLQSAWNFVWSHNRNRGQWPWTMGDGTWVMFDYHRGYDERLEYSGLMDVFRLPRFIYRFFQVQYLPKPAVHICSDWTPREGVGKVVVFANGDQVQLWLNGRLLRTQSPDAGPDTVYGDYLKGGNPWDGGNGSNLVHPPFTFFDVPYESGELKAVALRDGKPIAEHVVRTPGKPAALRLRVDQSGRPLRADGADCVFLYADVVDERGTVCTLFEGEVRLVVSGPVKVVGPSRQKVENGTASFLVQSSGPHGRAELKVSGAGLNGTSLFLALVP